MSKTMRAKKRGAAGWCEANGIGPGDKLEAWLHGWVPVTLTALGQSAILIRRKGAMEFAVQDPGKIRWPQVAALEGDPK